MAKVFSTIDADLADWIAQQRMFFVSTAPNAAEGLLNRSPTGLDSLRVLDERTVAYLDLTGSGNETVAHLKENGRIVVMMCAFEGAPRILRIHGIGEVFEKGSAEYSKLVDQFPDYLGARSIIRIAVERIADSCGWGVPLYAYHGERDALQKWADKKGDAGITEYQQTTNARSIDGLRGLAPGTCESGDASRESPSS